MKSEQKLKVINITIVFNKYNIVFFDNNYKKINHTLFELNIYYIFYYSSRILIYQ